MDKIIPEDDASKTSIEDDTSKKSEEILKDINDPHFTTELARYNLEINLDPEELKSNCFSKVENHLRTFISKAKTVAEKYDNRVILTGILPTISKNELEFDYMTPNPRYWVLNDMIKELKGKDQKRIIYINS